MAYARDRWHKGTVTTGYVWTDRHPDKPCRSDKACALSARPEDHVGPARPGLRWQAVWEPTKGREKTKAFTTKGEAERFAAASQTDANRGVWHDADAGKVSLKDFAAEWLAHRTAGATTRESYANTIKWYINPILGNRQLRQIKPSDIQAWVSRLQRQEVASAKLADGSPGPTRTLSVNTIKQAKRVLSALLESAVADELILKNPAKGIRLPKAEAKPVEVWPLALVQAVSDSLDAKWKALPILMVGAGLRPGEAFGLSVDDVDFLRRTIHVRRQVVIVSSKLIYSEPKHGSRREVPLTQEVSEALAQHLAAFPSVGVELPWADVDGPKQSHRLLFSTRERGAINKNYFSAKHWRPARVANGVPDIRANGLHVLRHTYASLLLANGIGVPEVAAYLGHADPGITLRTYGHLIPGSPERSRLAIEAAFRQSRDESTRPAPDRTG